MTFIPLFFKLGVISTILIFLTAMTAKGLLIGITLLFFNFTGFFAKFYSNKLGSQHSTPSWHYPHAASSWVQPTVVKPTIKNIHVHVHPPAASSHHSEDHSVHYPIEEYGSTLHHRPSSLYGHKLSSLDSNDIYQHYPSVSTEYEIHNHHQPHVFEHKMDYVGNSLLPDSTGAMHSTNIYQPNLLQRYDDISTISSPGAVLTAEENAYIQRILSKLS
ncbi:uncharacterized protein LOC123300889 [Chrysoperla carnea]|uniref:uncharacterized protein LOC123300889 n=1 Tax=Chrysoperla carnea TaxID=189513 RepID=UPI001D0741A6|nr:uncharacterized protein LOC123300889 [Chrysoperla carnea]